MTDENQNANNNDVNMYRDIAERYKNLAEVSGQVAAQQLQIAIHQQWQNIHFQHQLLQFQGQQAQHISMVTGKPLEPRPQPPLGNGNEMLMASPQLALSMPLGDTNNLAMVPLPPALIRQNAVPTRVTATPPPPTASKTAPIVRPTPIAAINLVNTPQPIRGIQKQPNSNPQTPRTPAGTPKSVRFASNTSASVASGPKISQIVSTTTLVPAKNTENAAAHASPQPITPPGKDLATKTSPLTPEASRTLPIVSQVPQVVETPDSSTQAKKKRRRPSLDSQPPPKRCDSDSSISSIDSIDEEYLVRGAWSGRQREGNRKCAKCKATFKTARQFTGHQNVCPANKQTRPSEK